MKNINTDRRGCSSCINALVFVPTMGIGVAAMGNEKFNRKMAKRGQIDQMIATVKPSFEEMVPNLNPFVEGEGYKGDVVLDEADFKRFALAHADQKDWQWVNQTAHYLADVVEFEFDQTEEGKVKYLTAMGKLTKGEMGTMAADMSGAVKSVQDWYARHKWGDEQWRMEMKDVVKVVADEKIMVDSIVMNSHLLALVGVENGEKIGEILPEYTDLVGTYTFESGQVGDDVMIPLRSMDKEIKKLLEGSSLKPQDILNMVSPGSSIERYTTEVEAVRSALRNVNIIN